MAFSEILGQQRPVRILQSALGSGDISHAYLFSGPEGIGKRLTALNFAKALNCLSVNDDSCIQCLHCKKFKHRNFPDFLTIEPVDGSIKIDVIRELQKKISLRPYEGRFKVVLIERVEEMTVSAANSFLKTLEEPTESTIFILLCSNINSLLATIVSRCQRIHFNLIPIETIKNVLIDDDQIMPEEAQLIASYSQGRLGKAKGMDINDLTKTRADILDFLKEISFKKIDFIFKKSKAWSRNDENSDMTLTAILNIIRDLSFLKIRINEKLVANLDVKDTLLPLIRDISVNQLTSLFYSVEQFIRYKKRNVNSQLSMDLLLIKMCAVFDRGTYGKN